MQHTYHCLLGVNLPETAYVQSSSPLGLSRTKVELYLATILVFWMAQQNHPQCSHVQHRCMHVLSDRLSFACQCCKALQNEMKCAVLCCAVLCCAVLFCLNRMQHCFASVAVCNLCSLPCSEDGKVSSLLLSACPAFPKAALP